MHCFDGSLACLTSLSMTASSPCPQASWCSRSILSSLRDSRSLRMPGCTRTCAWWPYPGTQPWPGSCAWSAMISCFTGFTEQLMVRKCTFANVFPLYINISSTLIGHFTTCLFCHYEGSWSGGESGRGNFPGKCYVRPHLWTPNPKLYLIPTLAWCTNWVASFWDFLVRQTTIYHHQFPLAVIIITYQICTQHVQTRVNNRRDIILLNIIYSILLYYIIYQYYITQYYLLNIIYYITQYYLLLVQIYTCTQHTDSVCCYRD